MWLCYEEGDLLHENTTRPVIHARHDEKNDLSLVVFCEKTKSDYDTKGKAREIRIDMYYQHFYIWTDTDIMYLFN